MQESKVDCPSDITRHETFQLFILTAMLLFVVWALLSMNQAHDQKFRFEALSRCRVLEVAIADILQGQSHPQVSLVQQRIDKLVRRDPRILRLSVIAMAGNGEYRHIASSLPSRIGQPAHDEDLKVFSSGEIIYLEEEVQGRSALDLTYPVHDFDGKIVAVLGYTVGRESLLSGSLALSSLGLLTLCLLLFYFRQARLLSHQQHALQQGLHQQLKAEEALREMDDRLHQAKKMEAIGLLAGGVAHDLNNMLTGIVGYPELMQQDENLTSRQLSHLNTIRETGLRISDVVSDMQVLSRSSAVSRKPFNLNQVIEGYLSSPEFIEKQQAHQTRIEVDLDPCLPWVEGKEHHLRKIVMNLLVNAMEASGPQGRVDIFTSVRTLAEPLEGYETIPAGDYVRLRIRDGGRGIAPELLRRIFEPFFSQKAMDHSGTGLGLAICWSIVHDHEGYFDLHNNNPGAIFDVYLPRNIHNDEQMEEMGASSLVRGAGESILIIDDEPIPRQVASAMLRTLDYQVIEAESGEAALAILGQRKVDLLLLDMIMDPGIGGLATYRKALERHPEQKALLASGQAETAEVEEALRLGAGALLRKPLDLQSLSAAVAAELLAPFRCAKIGRAE